MLTVLARWCARHRNYVIGAWLVMLVALGGALGAVGSAFSDNAKLPSSDSATAHTLLGNAGSHAASGTSGTIAWHTATGSAVSASAQAQIAPMLAQVSQLPGVVSVSSPFPVDGSPQDGSTATTSTQVSADRQTAYATVLFASTSHTGDAKTLATHASTAGLTVQIGGRAFTNQIPSETGEIIGVLAALLILLLVFRSGWAAALPIITGVAGVGLSTVAVMLLSNVFAMSSIVTSMSALIGLGVGIDYALFIVNRQRKALRAGADVPTAAVTAMTTSGRAVLFAGGTVIIALLGMLVLGVGFLAGMAVAAGVTVALTVLAATTLLPALLGKVGLRVLRKRDRVALASGAALADEQPGVWARWSQVVRRRPAVSSLAAATVLITLALPMFALRLGSADASSDPHGSSTRGYHDTMSQAFGDGFESQLLLVAQTPDAGAQAAWTRLVGELPSVSGVASVSASSAVGSPSLSMVTVTPTTTSQAKATADLVSALRRQTIPSAEAGTQLQVHVGGLTATSIDFAEALTSKLPLFLIVVTVLGFLLLVVAFRSLAIPAIGALGNLLTMAVSLGATVALFQWGWAPPLFGVGGGAPVEYMVAMLIVAVVFGLAMDYHVFLISRMHEEWTRTGDHHTAVRAGVSDTGRVIATAATIMACVFASFGFSGMRTASEFGGGLAVAVLADAFLLRMTIIPAVLHLTGSRAWALPKTLDRVLPHVSVEGADDPYSPPAAIPVDVVAAREPDLVGVR
ncbi:MAG: MMPL family transporter [Frankiaceae bacterium]|jgi:RND superfamily putative drug exporter|nr:MMPL family transporter [Frankiaceae bacterium]